MFFIVCFLVGVAGNFIGFPLATSIAGFIFVLLAPFIIEQDKIDL